MKIHILSDLHNEFTQFEAAWLQEVSCDVTILAGDIDLGCRGVEWLLEHSQERPVLYVPGNHEYYGNKIPHVQQHLSDATAGTHIHILNNEEYVMGDVRFLGATLWTDFQALGLPLKPIAIYEAQQTMADYFRIRLGAQHGYRKLRPADTIRFHQEARTFLEEKFHETFPGKTVVITHHAPSLTSLPVNLQQNVISAALCSDLEWMMRQYAPHLWIHGHIHTSVDRTIDKTRILCNPRGYAPDDLVETFQPNFVVDI